MVRPTPKISRWMIDSSKTAKALARDNDIRADLERAADALRLARKSEREGRPEEAPHFVDSAVMAYTLCFTNSQQRVPLEVSVVPEEFLHIHKGVRRYRNRAVAHVDSEVQQTVVLVMLDKRADGVTSRGPVVATARTQLPSEFREPFEALVNALIDVMDDRIEAKVNGAQLSPAQAQHLWDTGQELPKGQRTEWIPQ